MVTPALLNRILGKPVILPGMPVRRGLAGMAAAFLFASGVAAALADVPTTTTTTNATETTAVATTTFPSITTATTSATTTAATTTVMPATTTTAPRSVASTTSALSATAQCPLGALVIAPPDAAPIVVGAVATARARTAGLSALRYPASGVIARTATVSLSEQSCTKGAQRSARIRIRSVSLFGGSVSASAIALTIGRTATSTIADLVVDGKHVTPIRGARVPLQSWGEVVAGPRTPIAIAAGHEVIAALVIHLVQAHAGLAAGTTVLVGVAGVPAESAKRSVATRRKKRAKHEPLKVTPPLGVRGLIFPVVGPSEYVDTYGAFRSDVPGNWHHGDDIFAALGTPVVAVASGTINRVGWEKLGGWRLWVRDGAGDEFYYAHLSGYAPTDLHSNRVKAGEVIGFVGNTGDAFTTSPHLHFEVHPRPLLHLNYDGAVDPTTYLNSWPHLEHARAPRPTHPPLPKQPLIRREAAYVFRELLAARHLIKHAPKASARPHIAIPPGANGVVANAEALPAAAAPGHPDQDASTLVVTLFLGFAGVGLAAAVAPASRRRLAPLLLRLRSARRP